MFLTVNHWLHTHENVLVHICILMCVTYACICSGVPEKKIGQIFITTFQCHCQPNPDDTKSSSLIWFLNTVKALQKHMLLLYKYKIIVLRHLQSTIISAVNLLLNVV